MRILILTDGAGWIVDRITNRIIDSMPEIEFTLLPYTGITTDLFIEVASKADLVHYNNWDIQYHWPACRAIKTPFLYTIRSFRYPDYVLDVVAWATRTLVINPHILKEYRNVTFIPDGIDDMFKPDHEFTVGYAGKPDDYKGYNIIKQACDELGCKFKPALDLPPEWMPDYYKSIDLYVCASEAEGHSTPVMECLAMNIPVVTTCVGIPAGLNLHFAERTVEGLKREISKFYTAPQVLEYSWDKIIPQIKKLYYEVKG